MIRIIHLATSVFLALCIGSYASAQQIDADWYKYTDEKHFPTIVETMENYFQTIGKDDQRGHKHWVRWMIDHENSIDQNGYLINRTKINFDEHHRFQMRHEVQSRSATGSWFSLGPNDADKIGIYPGSGVGRVHAIAFHPTDDSVIFVGTPNGGIWKTDNEGQSWHPISDGLPRTSISDIVMNHLNPQSIYILTGDGDAHTNPTFGVLKSNNGGETWLSTGAFGDYTTNRRFAHELAMHPTDTSILFVAIDGGMYKSTDAGLSWNLVLANTICDIEFKTNDPTTVFASARGDVVHFYKSTDNGDSFTSTVAGLPTSIVKRSEIALSPTNPNLIYLLTGQATQVGKFSGIYISLNAGQSFTLALDTPNILGRKTDGLDNVDQGDFDLQIVVNPADEDHVITGGVNIWHSHDAASTITNLTHWIDGFNVNFVHADHHVLVYHPRTGKLFSGNDGGIYWSANHGSSWTDITAGIEIATFYGIDIQEQVPDFVAGGLQDNGTMLTNTPSKKFSEIRRGDGYHIDVDPTNSFRMIYSNNEGILYTTDPFLGSTIITPPNVTFKGNTPVHISPNNTAHLICSYSTETYRSKNGSGGNWLQVGPGGRIGAFEAPGEPNICYLVSSRSIMRSNNWQLDTPTYSNADVGLVPDSFGLIKDFVVDPENPLNVYICFSNNNKRWAVAQSANGGASWTNITSSGFPNVPCQSIDYQPGSDQALYVGTDIGVFYRDTVIGGWIPFRNGLPVTRCNDIKVDTASGFVTVGTYGRGIWRSPLYSNCPAVVNVSGQTPPGYNMTKASQNITSTRVTADGIGHHGVHQAGDYVNMMPGFEVKTGSEFTVRIDQCDNPGIPRQERRIRGFYGGTLKGVIHSVAEDQAVSEERYLRIYPNPFDGITHLEFKIAEAGKVDIAIYAVDGSLIENLMSIEAEAGTFKTTLDLSTLQMGMHYLKVIGHGWEEVAKLVRQ